VAIPSRRAKVEEADLCAAAVVLDPAMTAQTRNRLTFAMLCCLARKVLEQERSIDDAEWKERIKCRIARERRAYPTPEELASVLAAVERALEKQWGPRPVEIPVR
jgi:hypothetical protein